jgi:Galactose oxidase, central domain/Kelch motif
VASAWTATGDMIEGLTHHTATLLQDGKVLVAGGLGGFLYRASAELYDPVNGTWTATGSMRVARGHHTATLLRSGKVLVSGGDDGGGGAALASAELYDPVNGTWTVTGSMRVARGHHTATLLPSGKVLVSGGDGADSGNVNPLDSAELYDPSSGTWTATGRMIQKRLDYTATLLPSGKVLVVGGGDEGGEALNSAELYDPDGGSWTATGAMTQGRYGHTATLLANGKLLVAGGASPGDIHGEHRVLATAELYDPISGTWSATVSMREAHEYHTATLLANGKLLVAGGDSAGRYNGEALDSAELYDPSSGPWIAIESMREAREGQTATLLPGGAVLMSGGYGGEAATDLASAELYNPAGGS